MGLDNDMKMIILRIIMMMVIIFTANRTVGLDDDMKMIVMHDDHVKNNQDDDDHAKNNHDDHVKNNHDDGDHDNFCSERDSGIGGITIGPVARNRGSNGDMIIGNDDHNDDYR